MTGYIGDLSYKQQLALNQLKDRLKDVWDDEFTDAFLLRWLRARDFDVPKAESMLRRCLEWRRENDIDNFLQTYECPEVFKRYYPGGLSGHDRCGRPIWITPVGNGDFKGMMHCVSKQELIRYFIYIVEVVHNDQKKQTQKLGRVVDNMVSIVDYENFSLRQMTSPQVLDITREAMALYDNYYPEGLHQVFAINAPAIFPIFWRIVRPFLSQKTVDKVRVFGREGWQAELLKNIDPSELPVHWGGTAVGPDGDPRCSHLINPGGEVPQEFYLRNAPKVSDNPDAITCVLEPGDSVEVPFNVDRPGALLEWMFQTKGYDVAFGLFLVMPNSANRKEILQLRRINCDLSPMSGQMECTEPGTYIFKFDNSFSWLTKKHLSYIIQINFPEFGMTASSMKLHPVCERSV